MIWTYLSWGSLSKTCWCPGTTERTRGSPRTWFLGTTDNARAFKCTCLQSGVRCKSRSYRGWNYGLFFFLTPLRRFEVRQEGEKLSELRQVSQKESTNTGSHDFRFHNKFINYKYKLTQNRLLWDCFGPVGAFLSTSCLTTTSSGLQ